MIRRLLLPSIFIAACGETPEAPLTDAGVPASGDGGIAEVDAGSTARDAAITDSGTASCTSNINDEPGLVKTAFGAFLGVEVGQRSTVFRGIPFAAAPTSDRRWTAPRDPECVPAAVRADTFGPACPQMAMDSPIGNEDCLMLNVWTPRQAPGVQSLPVMVFIHGGGNAQGSSAQTVNGQVIYDGVGLTDAQDVLFVTIQYRLGALGWLAHPRLDNGGGNFGTLDQIRALEWVRRNIASFGGDPQRAIIFGESAGARNVCVLVASPLAADLFQGAIMESGGCVVPEPAAVRESSDQQIERSGCALDPDPLGCLRAVPADQMLRDNPPVIDVAGFDASKLQPTIDGVTLLGQPNAVITAGNHNHVAVIVGANADETSMSVSAIESVAAYEALVRSTVGAALGARVLAAYPASDFPTPRDAFIAVTSDAKFICGARRDTRAFAAGQSEPVYRYFFTQGLTNAPRLSVLGAYHGIELFFVFDNLEVGNYRPSPAESALADSLGGYWTRFADDGDPNDASATVWPAYDAAADRTLVLGDPIEAVDGVRTERCDFWDSLF